MSTGALGNAPGGCHQTGKVDQDMSRNGIVVVGDALIDELVTADGHQRRSPGGAALNLAVGLARLGGRPSLLCQLGDDDDGRELRRLLGREGVVLLDQPTPYGTGVATSRERAGVVSYEFSATIVQRHFNFTEQVRQAMGSSRGLVLNSFPIGDPAQVDDVLDAQRQAGCVLAVDPNVRPALMPDLAACGQGLIRLAGAATLVKLSREDLTLLYPEETNAAAVVSLLNAGTQVVIETDGPRGAHVHTVDYSLHVLAAPLTGPVVSTVGAGDAVLARLSLDLGSDTWPVSKDAWRPVLAEAMAAAAATCQAPGGTIPVSFAQILRRTA